MATIRNQRDLSLQASNPRLITTSLSIASAGGSFTKLKNAGISPASIVLSSTPVGLGFAPTDYQWYYASSTTPTSWTSLGGGPSATTYTVTSGNYTTHRGSGSSVTYKCVATKAGWLPAESFSTITYAVQADDTPLVFLSKETISIPSNAAGTSMTYTDSGCTIQASLSGTFLNYHASNPSTFSVAVSASNITADLVGSGTGTTRTYGVLSGMTAGTTVVATVTYTITVRDANSTAFVFTKTQTITKALTGADGATSTVPGPAGDKAVFAYRILTSTSLPSAPSITQSTVPNSGTAVSSTTWYLQPKSTALASNEWMFQVSGTVTTGGAYTWQTQGYLSTFKVGSLEALSANLGTVTAGAITGTSTLDITGTAHFRNGSTSTSSLSSVYIQAPTLGIAPSFGLVVQAHGTLYGNAIQASVPNTNNSSSANAISAQSRAGVAISALSYTGTAGSFASRDAEGAATGPQVKCATPLYDLQLSSNATGTGGINFPATFNDNTNANTLDDYEEGSWTPALNCGAGSATLSGALGRYTKIGNKVFITCTVTVSSVSTPSGDLQLTGLPFAPNNVTELYNACSIYANTLNSSWTGNSPTTTGWGNIMATIGYAASVIYIRRFFNGGESLDMAAALKAGSKLIISGSYTTN